MHSIRLILNIIHEYRLIKTILIRKAGSYFLIKVDNTINQVVNFNEVEGNVVITERSLFFS